MLRVRLRPETAPPGSIPLWASVSPDLFTLTVAASNSGRAAGAWPKALRDRSKIAMTLAMVRMIVEYARGQDLFQVFRARGGAGPCPASCSLYICCSPHLTVKLSDSGWGSQSWLPPGHARRVGVCTFSDGAA